MTVIFSIGLSHCSIERRYSGGAGLMKMLSPEEMQELRNEIADFAISESRKDEIIHLLDAIAASFIHQAFRKSSVQFSLSARPTYPFTTAATPAIGRGHLYTSVTNRHNVFRY